MEPCVAGADLSPRRGAGFRSAVARPGSELRQVGERESDYALGEGERMPAGVEDDAQVEPVAGEVAGHGGAHVRVEPTSPVGDAQPEHLGVAAAAAPG